MTLPSNPALLPLTSMNPLTAIAQLRHLYAQMVGGYIVDTEQAACNLLEPAIEALEKVHAPGAPVEVKPLVWTETPYLNAPARHYWTTTWHGLKAAEVCHLNGLFKLCLLPGAGERFSEHSTLAVAQAAAQAEWSALVRSALQQ